MSWPSLPLAPDVRSNLGARLDMPTRATKRKLLLAIALDVFTSAGVTHLRVQREADVSNLGDLPLYSLDEPENIAAEKGGIRQLLDEKWRKVYKAGTPRGLFSVAEMQVASMSPGNCLPTLNGSPECEDWLWCSNNPLVQAFSAYR